MVTRRTPRTLGVWANGQLVGHWSLRDGQDEFQYHGGWLDSQFARPLSLSLPFTPGNAPYRGAIVRNYFDNLLPDNDAIRSRLREKFVAPGTDAFSLLTAIGRDCVGAVQLLPPGEGPEGHDRISFASLDETGVEQALTEATSRRRLPGEVPGHQFRISLAGAQEKTALLFHRGRWAMPEGATPTTHIFKLPLGLIGNIRADMSDSVENEWLCGRLLSLFGLPVAPSEIGRFGRTKALVVERFDRQLQRPADAPAWIARLPQEDFCQAFGLPGAQRYEAEGGPGMQAILRRLETGKHPAADRLLFVKAQFVFWLLAATDGHAKNFSIFLERDGFCLTPLYDVLSVWPIIGDGPNQLHWRNAKLAMAIRGRNTHCRLYEIQARHWDALSRQLGLPDAFDQLVALALQVPQVLAEAEALLPGGFPRRVFLRIGEGMKAQAGRFIDTL